MKRHPGLDTLRAAAIAWVLLFHATTEGLGRPIPGVCEAGWMAVDLFFVLSGYLIGGQLFVALIERGTVPFRSFYTRRALRILPAYFLVVAVYVAFPMAREQPGLSPAWQFLTFTENFLIDYQHCRALSHAWSLCVEEHFYLLLPALVAVTWPWRSVKLTLAMAAGVFVAGLAYRWLAWSHGLAGGAVLRASPYRFVEVIYYPTLARADGLLAGVALAALKYFRPKIWAEAMARAWLLLGAAAVVLVLAIWVALPRTTFAAAVFGFPLLALGFALLVAAAASEQGLLGRWRIPGASFVATITFSLYLSHKMTWHLLHLYAPRLVPAGTVQAFFVYAIGAVAVGTALYFTVERSFLRMRERQRNKTLEPATMRAAA